VNLKGEWDGHINKVVEIVVDHNIDLRKGYQKEEKFQWTFCVFE
jgi:hypothetical protein